ncbi:hypothetical protein QUB60_20460 [Microcoleus sp. A2-C5]
MIPELEYGESKDFALKLKIVGCETHRLRSSAMKARSGLSC